MTGLLPRPLAAVALCVAGLTVPLLGPPAQASSPAPPTAYYLSLGDSLALGVQPDQHGTLRPRTDGYADDLLAIEHAERPDLRLQKFGCSGETTKTMTAGGICQYRGHSAQLDAAVRFLQAHQGAVPLVTLDLGADDLLSCLSFAKPIDTACAQNAVQQVTADLPSILAKLRAADPSAQFVGMTYYDPVLAAGLLGPAGQQEADASLALVDALNGVLRTEFAQAGFAVAQVDQGFDTHDTTPVNVPGLGTEPTNLAAVCKGSWACTPPPVGPDVHPNQTGYQEIAQLLAAVVHLPVSSASPSAKASASSPASASAAPATPSPSARTSAIAAASPAPVPSTSGIPDSNPSDGLAPPTGTQAPRLASTGVAMGATLTLAGVGLLAFVFGVRVIAAVRRRHADR